MTNRGRTILKRIGEALIVVGLLSAMAAALTYVISTNAMAISAKAEAARANRDVRSLRQSVEKTQGDVHYIRGVVDQIEKNTSSEK